MYQCVLLVTKVAGIESLHQRNPLRLPGLYGRVLDRWTELNLQMDDSFPGQLPKWPNGADCKSAVFDFGGSNPSLPTDYLATCPCGAAVAHSLGKTGVMGSIPITGSCGMLKGTMPLSRTHVFSIPVVRPVSGTAK